MKFQNLKKFWMKIQKIGIFFNQMWLKVSHQVPQKQKKVFLIVDLFFIIYKAFLQILGINISPKHQIVNFEEGSYFSNVSKMVKKKEFKFLVRILV